MTKKDYHQHERSGSSSVSHSAEAPRQRAQGRWFKGIQRKTPRDDRRWEGEKIDGKGKVLQISDHGRARETWEMSGSSDLEAVSPKDVPRSAEHMKMSDVQFGNREKNGKNAGYARQVCQVAAGSSARQRVSWRKRRTLISSARKKLKRMRRMTCLVEVWRKGICNFCTG